MLFRSSTSTSNRQGTQAEFDATRRNGNRRGRQVPGSFQVEEQTTTTTTTTSVSVGVDLDQQRTGEQFTVIERVDTESLGEAVVSREVLHFMRARNVECISTSMKPFTKLYAFFDSVDVNSFCYPKLLEVQMETGTFQVGETVTGVMPTAEQNEDVDPNTVPNITFRVATLNHKYGPYNDPNDIYDENPYLRGQALPSVYSTESRILNIDTASLASEESPDFKGYARIGMRLEGETSGAVAEITNMVLFTDRVGTLQGTFRVPNTQLNDNHPQFETGRNSFRLTSSNTNTLIEGATTTSAEELFYSQGQANTTEEVTLSLRNASITSETLTETRDDPIESEINFDIINSTTLRPVPPPPAPPPPRRGDPLAQTFKVSATTGMYATKIDIFFQTKDELRPVTQIGRVHV